MELKPLTDEQRARARELATEARTVRAEVKAQLKQGSLTIAQVLERAAGDDSVGRLKVRELLEALPGVGRVRAGAIMEHIGISPTRRIRGLGVHQRSALIDYLDT